MTRPSDRGGPNWKPIALAALTWATAAPLSAFFGFVGWMKTFAPMEVLQQHHAWTTILPIALGRAIGVSEVACALVLVGALVLRRPTWVQVIAAILVGNQLFAAATHLMRDETGALPQNAVLIGLLIVTGLSAHAWRRGR